MLMIEKEYINQKIGHHYSGKLGNLKILNSEERFQFFVSLKISLKLAGYIF